MNAARTLFAQNPNLRFCFLSGQGADQAEKAFTLFGKIKGRTEKDLAQLSKNVFSFRPGYIEPSTPRAKHVLEETLVRPLVPLVNALTDNFSVRSAQLAKCLIDIAKNGAAEKNLDNRTIKVWK